MSDDDDELDTLTDYMYYAQLALVDQDNTASALERIEHLQAFREEYNVQDTYFGGCMLATRCMNWYGSCPNNIFR